MDQLADNIKTRSLSEALEILTDQVRFFFLLVCTLKNITCYNSIPKYRYYIVQGTGNKLTDNQRPIGAAQLAREVSASFGRYSVISQAPV